MRRKQVLILGGTGFVGEFLSRRLASKKKYSLKIVGREPVPAGNQGARYYRINLKTHAGRLVPLLSKTEILIILTRPMPEVIAKIINLARESKSLKKIIYASSLLVYPSSPVHLTETTTPKPQSEYERGKIAEEKILKKFSESGHCRVVVARFSNVYGGKKNTGLVGLVYKYLLNQGDFRLNGSGRQIRDYIFVEEVDKYLEFLVNRNISKTWELFNICSGRGYTINQVISMIEKITEKILKIVNGPAVREKFRIVGSNKKIVRLSDSPVKTGLRQGLLKTYNNFLKNR